MKKYLSILSVILIVSAPVLCLCACEENEITVCRLFYRK